MDHLNSCNPLWEDLPLVGRPKLRFQRVEFDIVVFAPCWEKEQWFKDLEDLCYTSIRVSASNGLFIDTFGELMPKTAYNFKAWHCTKQALLDRSVRHHSTCVIPPLSPLPRLPSAAIPSPPIRFKPVFAATDLHIPSHTHKHCPVKNTFSVPQNTLVVIEGIPGLQPTLEPLSVSKVGEHRNMKVKLLNHSGENIFVRSGSKIGRFYRTSNLGTYRSSAECYPVTIATAFCVRALPAVPLVHDLAEVNKFFSLLPKVDQHTECFSVANHSSFPSVACNAAFDYLKSEPPRVVSNKYVVFDLRDIKVTKYNVLDPGPSQPVWSPVTRPGPSVLKARAKCVNRKQAADGELFSFHHLYNKTGFKLPGLPPGRTKSPGLLPGRNAQVLATPSVHSNPSPSVLHTSSVSNPQNDLTVNSTDSDQSLAHKSQNKVATMWLLDALGSTPQQRSASPLLPLVSKRLNNYIDSVDRTCPEWLEFVGDLYSPHTGVQQQTPQYDEHGNLHLTYTVSQDSQPHHNLKNVSLWNEQYRGVIEDLLAKHPTISDAVVFDPSIIRGLGVEYDVVFSERPVPFRSGAFRLSPIDQAALAKILAKYKAMNWVKESNSPWAAPTFLVPKKSVDKDGNKEYRLVIDFRKLNDQTVKLSHPLPKIDTIFDDLGGSKIFSNLDLQSGYHQIPLTEAASNATGFVCSEGHFQFNVLPFGVHSAPPAFQRMMERVLQVPISKGYCKVYLDDILVYSPSPEAHKSHLSDIFGCLSRANLRIRPDKCNFFQTEIQHLGHTIGPHGISVDRSKVEDMATYKRPSTLKQLQSFMGLANYYRKFVPRFSDIAAPIFDLYKHNCKAKNPAIVSESDPEMPTAQQLTACYADMIYTPYNVYHASSHGQLSPTGINRLYTPP